MDGLNLNVKIDTSNPLYADPLVDLRDYGFADAESYYSKPNRFTGKQLPGVKNQPFVRNDVAKRLVLANDWLQTSNDVRKLLGDNVRLKIDDAYRSFRIQKYAYEVAWPAAIKSSNPQLTEAEVKKLVKRYCAEPGDGPSATPHQTGGAVDVKIVFLASGKTVERGYISGDSKPSAYTDFYENLEKLARIKEPKMAEIIYGRRILYYAMVNVAGLQSNPKEIWHYGIGDPLSAHLGGYKPYYYYIN